MVMFQSEQKTDVSFQPTPPAPDFRHIVSTLQTLNQADMGAVNETILEYMQSPVAMIPAMAKHLIEAGGKRLRPLLTLCAARGLGYEGNDHILLAAAVELIHGATLLHDDVVDESSLRRGAKTANVIWGNKESVLVGDFIFSRSFELMVKTDNLKVLGILSHASGVIAQGEVMQLETQKNIQATFDMCLAVIKAKTAALFAAAGQSGAVVASATPEQEQALYNYGLNLGIAFQLVDDALDYSGDQQALGKSVGDDFREGKMTLPVIYAIADAKTAQESGFWQRTLGDGEQGHDDLAEAQRLMGDCDAIPRTINCAQEYAHQAVEDLAIFPENEYIENLKDLARTSVARVF